MSDLLNDSHEQELEEVHNNAFEQGREQALEAAALYVRATIDRASSNSTDQMFCRLFDEIADGILKLGKPL